MDIELTGQSLQVIVIWRAGQFEIVYHRAIQWRSQAGAHWGACPSN